VKSQLGHSWENIFTINAFFLHRHFVFIFYISARFVTILLLSMSLYGQKAAGYKSTTTDRDLEAFYVACQPASTK